MVEVVEVREQKKEERKRKERKRNRKERKRKRKKKEDFLTCPISCPALVTCTLPSWWIDTIAGLASTLITNLHAAIARPRFTNRFPALCPAIARRRPSTSAPRLSRDHILGTVYLGVFFFRERERGAVLDSDSGGGKDE